MLTILGKRHRFCDGISRRSLLRVGGLALGGLSLPQILRAEAQTGVRRSHKSIIMVFLPGGPPHLDMYDLKPDAPVGIRGEFDPIATNVPGIEICELMPRMAAMMDKFAIIRSLVGAPSGHTSIQCLTGQHAGPQPAGGWPSLGSVVSKLQGPTHPSIPPFVGLASQKHLTTPTLRDWLDPGPPGFLGAGHAPFVPGGEQMANDIVLNGIALERLGDRKNLVASLDRFRRHVDASGMMEGMDVFNQQAFNILASSKLLETLDLTREDPRVIQRYGRGGPKLLRGSGAYHDTIGTREQFLIARRLVEAGVRCVTLTFGMWDWHSENFTGAKNHLPKLDQAIAALVQDIHDRGLDQDVTVVVWGEFGRSPQIGKTGGREHWPQVSNALLAGGGMRTGQVIGSTTRLGEEVKDRHIHYQNVFATLYHNLGIDASQTTLTDLNGRPHYLLEHSEPIADLI